MNDLKGKYEEAVRERADAFVKAATIEMIGQNAAEYDELKKQAEELHLSDEFQEKKRTLIESLEKADREKARRKRMKSFGKIAAVILLCLVTVFTVLTATVDAFRYRVFDFLQIDHGEYLELVPEESNPLKEEEKALLPDDWKGLFYPTLLPEGFRLIEAFEGGSIRDLTFGDDKDHFLSLSVSPAGKTKTGVDNEDVKKSEVDINGVKGYAWEKDGTCLIIWINYEHQFDLFSDSLTPGEMLKIAESIRYFEIK
ncbi:MAG TPA: DUF4367 domain-containing protein [Bacillota bacterium]|nr:DUF4367 domain-containing protein [Bacillota bacterium]